MTFNQCRDHGHGMVMVWNGARVEHPPTSGQLRQQDMVSTAGHSATGSCTADFRWKSWKSQCRMPPGIPVSTWCMCPEFQLPYADASLEYFGVSQWNSSDVPWIWQNNFYCFSTVWKLLMRMVHIVWEACSARYIFKILSSRRKIHQFKAQ